MESEKPWFIRSILNLLTGKREIAQPNEHHYGYPQVYFENEPNPERLIGLLSPAKGSTIYILTTYFDDDWKRVTNASENKCWVTWLIKQVKENDVSIKVVGNIADDGINSEIIESIELLEAASDKVEFYLVDKPQTTHIVFVTDPVQLWLEASHLPKTRANHCYFTEKPFADTLEDVSNKINNALRVGRRFNPSDYLASSNHSY